MLFVLSPFCAGGIMGWMIFYFIRKYDCFTPTTLLGTLSALIGEDVIAFLLTMREKLQLSSTIQILQQFNRKNC